MKYQTYIYSYIVQGVSKKTLFKRLAPKVFNKAPRGSIRMKISPKH